MSSIKTVEQFHEQLNDLNVQLISIEKNVTQKTDHLICDHHQKFADPFTEFNKKLTLIKQKYWLKHHSIRKPLKQRLIHYFSTIKREKLAK